MRRNKSFQSVGGAAQLDEAREAVLLVRGPAVERRYVVALAGSVKTTLAVGVRDAQKLLIRQVLDWLLARDGGAEGLELLLVGVHGPAGACEREEWSCLIIASLKVCSIKERGAGGGQTSPRGLSKEEGGQLWLARIGSSRVGPHSELCGRALSLAETRQRERSTSQLVTALQ